MKKRNGTYLLFMTFPVTFRADIGSLGTLTMERGEYCYVGSAMNGLDQRIRRHLSSDKRMRWHIDRLTVCAEEKHAYISETIPECVLAEMAVQSGCIPVHKGFGCSDCGCRTHLFMVSGTSKRELLNISSAAPF
ncbi:MAG: GIY-YIG nuclease family protein [Methanomassiliicoccaceae archaeon]|nr:GIY-YIG nuclease family protein [Methanomassiliicoccaceae archaeon]